MVTQTYFGNYTYFGWIDITKVETSHQPGSLLAVALLCGVAGGLFARLLIGTASLPGHLGKWRSNHPVRFAAGCGLVLATLGWFSGGISFGTGYEEAKQLLNQSAPLPWHFGLDKFVATAVSFASGVPGGIFAPSLAVGAGLGQNLHDLQMMIGGSGYPPGMTSLLCMAGFLAAVTQTPITAFVIVMEMVSGYGLVLDLMVVTLLSSGVARTFCPPLYRTLATRYLRPASSSLPPKPQTTPPADTAP